MSNFAAVFFVFQEKKPVKIRFSNDKENQDSGYGRSGLGK